MILKRQIFGVVAMMAFWSISGAFCATEEPLAIPTFHCIGLYWNPEEGGEEITCDVRYRLANSDEWKEAMPLWFDPRGPEEHSRTFSNRRDREPKPQHDYARQYRGSIVNLTPGTEYEVELSLQNTEIQRRLNVNTWSEDFPVGKTVVLPETSDETLVIEEPGSPEGYILYTGAPGLTATIDGKSEINQDVDSRIKGTARYTVEFFRPTRLLNPQNRSSCPFLFSPTFIPRGSKTRSIIKSSRSLL
jgi:hypothetical protein